MNAKNMDNESHQEMIDADKENIANCFEDGAHAGEQSAWIEQLEWIDEVLYERFGYDAMDHLQELGRRRKLLAEQQSAKN